MNQPPVHDKNGRDEDGAVAGAPQPVVSPTVPSLGQLPAYCRICQLSNADGEKGDEPLEAAGCACSGSIQWVHGSCLLKWVRTRLSNRCEICNQFFTRRSYYPVPIRDIMGSIASLRDGRNHDNEETGATSGLWRSLKTTCNVFVALLILLFIVYLAWYLYRSITYGPQDADPTFSGTTTLDVIFGRLISSILAAFCLLAVFTVVILLIGACSLRGERRLVYPETDGETSSSLYPNAVTRETGDIGARGDSSHVTSVNRTTAELS